MWQLEIIHSPASLPITVFILNPGQTLIGREEGDIAISDPRISGRHCLLIAKDDGVEIVDQNSTNGTFLDGVRIERSPWSPGQILAVGGTEIRLSDLKAVEAPAGGTSHIALSDREFAFNILTERKIGGGTGDGAAKANPARVEALTRHLKVLQQSVRNLNGALSVSDILDRVMLLLFEAVQCDTGYILVTESDSEEIRAHLAYEKGRRKENLEERLYSRTLVSKVLQNKAGFLFNSGEGGTSLTGNADQSSSIFQLRIKTALCCPIHSEGRVFGVIYLDSKKRGSKFNPDDLDLALNVAGIAGMAIENLELYRKLRAEAAIRDNLRRFVSPNVADRIIAERGSGDFHLISQKAPISILFADIRGFTPLSEALSPITVANLLNAYFSQMCEIVFKNSGTLDKFIGDCMMVLFNAPFAVPDHEIAAVKTAVEMRRRLRQILPEWKRQGLPEIHVGIGVNSGEAVVGSLGTETRMEYTAIGDAVNIASRICSISKPDQILVTESVYEKVKDQFRTAMLGATQLKGKSRQVLVYEIVDDLMMPG